MGTHMGCPKIRYNPTVQLKNQNIHKMTPRDKKINEIILVII